MTVSVIADAAIYEQEHIEKVRRCEAPKLTCRCDSSDPDVVLCPLARKSFRECHKTHLCRTVVSLAEVTYRTNARSDICVKLGRGMY